ncbi:Cytosolic glutathione S-transferase 2B [Aphelenchoides fujianensis]|nr:Cytosolic glutathione S-transferase 2B [Aphelenchoides fujianensis]
MPNYRLTYFQPRALAECSRLVLVYSGQPFEDIRLTHDEFPKLKDTLGLPYGQLPLLEVDGQKIVQSGAIVRFLAKRFGLNGANEFESAKADGIHAFYYDMFRTMHPYAAARMGFVPGADTAKLHQEVFLPAARKALAVYDELVKWSSFGFVLESGISYADFVIAEHLHSIFLMEPSFADQFPALALYKKKIHGLPQIADYVKRRSNTIV